VLRHSGVVLLVLATVTIGAGQTERSPEALYRETAYRPAAAGFEARAKSQPDRWQHWYDAAAARYQAGEDAAAAALLTRALEIAPRAIPARNLWAALERQYEPLHQTRPIGRLAREELGIITLGGWWLFLLIAILARRSRAVRRSALAMGGAILLTGLLLWPRPRAPRAFLAASTGLRQAPYGLAPEQGSLPPLTLVTIAQRRGDWLLVADRLGNRGWLPSAALAPVDGVD
jgi:hypothetical protein